MRSQTQPRTITALLYVTAGLLLMHVAPPSAKAADLLFEGFRDPPAEARPFMRWWWNGNSVTEEEIFRELDLMAAAGAGGIEINPIAMPPGSQPTDAQPLVWLSPEWNRMVDVAVEGAKARDMIADLIVGTGWPFGGRFLSPDQTIEGITLDKKDLTGPATFTGTVAELTKPPRTPYEVEDKPAPRLLFLWLHPDNAQSVDAGIDLMDCVRADGKVEFEVPAGRHTLRIGTWQRSFRAVMWGAPGADGPVLDHYNKGAVHRYLERMSEELGPVLGGSLGEGLRAMFCDSIELSGANWTGDLPTEFQERRGYMLAPWLPFLLEEDDPQDHSEFADSVRRARYDFSRTLVELFHERFLLPFHAWCHETGTLSRYQAYGHPWLMGMLDGYMVPDIPEGDTWLFSGWDPLDGIRYAVWNKYAASGAHLTGKSVIGCEAMTNTKGVFRATLESIKQATDLSVITGVNHFVLHGWNYSPPEAGFPGWVRFGTYFSDQNPWWPHFHRWADYCARLSWVLQQSRPKAQIAILGPTADVWSRDGLDRRPFVYTPRYLHFLWQAIHQNGCSADYINASVLRGATFGGGKLRYGPMAYDALIVADVETLAPATAKAIQRFAQAGGQIAFAGDPPRRAPGMRDAEANDRRVRQAMRTTLDVDSGRVIQVDTPERAELLGWAGDVLAKLGTKRSVRFSAPHERLFQIHHALGDRDVFFVVNLHREDVLAFRAEFDATGTPWRWNLETGTRRIMPHHGSTIALRLQPLESLLVVFEPDMPGEAAEQELAEVKRYTTISAPWTVLFEHAVLDEQRELTFKTLRDLAKTEAPWLQAFAGTATYRTRFDVAHDEYDLLDLGQVYDISEVTLNGQPLGTCWWGRHRFELDGALRPGRNTLEIRVTTTLLNYCHSLENNPTAIRWTEGQESVRTGLVGPIHLLTSD